MPIICEKMALVFQLRTKRGLVKVPGLCHTREIVPTLVVRALQFGENPVIGGIDRRRYCDEEVKMCAHDIQCVCMMH